MSKFVFTTSHFPYAAAINTAHSTTFRSKDATKDTNNNGSSGSSGDHQRTSPSLGRKKKDAASAKAKEPVTSASHSDHALEDAGFYGSETVRLNLERRLLELTTLASVHPRLANESLRERSIMRNVRFPSPLEIPKDLPRGFLSPLPPSSFPTIPTSDSLPIPSMALLSVPGATSGSTSSNDQDLPPPTPSSPRPSLPPINKFLSFKQTLALAAPEYRRTDPNPMSLWESTCPNLLDALLPLLVSEPVSVEDAPQRPPSTTTTATTSTTTTTTTPHIPHPSSSSIPLQQPSSRDASEPIPISDNDVAANGGVTGISISDMAVPQNAGIQATLPNSTTHNHDGKPLPPLPTRTSSAHRSKVPTYAGYVWSVAKPGDSRVFLYKGFEGHSDASSKWTAREKQHVAWMVEMMRSMSSLDAARWIKFKVDPAAKQLTRKFVLGIVLYVLQRQMRLCSKMFVDALPVLMAFLEAHPDTFLYLPEEALESLQSVIGAAGEGGAKGTGSGAVTPTPHSESHMSPSGTAGALGIYQTRESSTWRGNATPPNHVPTPPSMSPKQASVSSLSVDLSIEDLLAHDPDPVPVPAKKEVVVEEDDDGFFSASSLRSPPQKPSILATFKTLTPPSTSPPSSPLAQPVRRMSNINKILPPPLILPTPKQGLPTVNVNVSSPPGAAVSVAAAAAAIELELRSRVKVVFGKRTIRIVGFDDVDGMTDAMARMKEGKDPVDGEDPEAIRLELLAEDPASMDSLDKHAESQVFQLVDSVMALSVYLERFLSAINNNTKPPPPSTPRTPIVSDAGSSTSTKPGKKRTGILSSPISPFNRGGGGSFLAALLSPSSPRPSSLLGASLFSRRSNNTNNAASNPGTPTTPQYQPPVVAEDPVRIANTDMAQTWFWGLPKSDPKRRAILKTVHKIASMAAATVNLLRSCCDQEYRHRIVGGRAEHIVFVDDEPEACVERTELDAEEVVVQILSSRMGLDVATAREVYQKWSSNAHHQRHMEELESLVAVTSRMDRPAVHLHPTMKVLSDFTLGKFPIPTSGKIRIVTSKLPCYQCYRLVHLSNIHLKAWLPALRMQHLKTVVGAEDHVDGEMIVGDAERRMLFGHLPNGSATSTPSMVRHHHHRHHHHRHRSEAGEPEEEAFVALPGTSAKVYPDWNPPPRLAHFHPSDDDDETLHPQQSDDTHHHGLAQFCAPTGRILEVLGDEVEEVLRMHVGRFAPVASASSLARMRGSGGKEEKKSMSSSFGEVTIDTSGWLKIV
ncbi:hypothetical protein HDU97_003874 [Phlyctochytrium planicorne]|nr:hypothetical protein HDU97_003874 [Phlyctochytrium planicorne]